MFYNTNLAEFNFFIVFLILLFLTKSCIVPKSEKRAFWKGKFQKIEAEEDLKEDGVIKLAAVFSGRANNSYGLGPLQRIHQEGNIPKVACCMEAKQLYIARKIEDVKYYDVLVRW